jgi:phosphate acyltransferase
MRIAVDAMGGDYAPREVVAGTVKAAREFSDTEFVLVGVEAAVREEMAKAGASPANISIFHTPEVVGMGEAPTEALKSKKNSSITVSTKMVAEGKADAIFSAGNTGAQVACATVLLGPIKSIKRPGIAIVVPTHKGPVVLIDVGANIHCQPLHLLQYGIMASLFSQAIVGAKSPRVGILNIGSEDEKGNPLVRESRQLLEVQKDLNFIGNVEGRDIFKGACDVVVCEGFVGNVILKVVEGLGSSLFADIQAALNTASPDRAEENKKVLKDLMGRNDYAEYGGAPLLGVNGISIIGHGSSNARAVFNALRVAREFGGRCIIEHIAKAV